MGQLFWREYFYVMSVPNPYYDQMKPNPICLNVPWSTGVTAKENLNLWKQGRTGYPFIDAGMRQLIQEGWQHHVTRNAVACFLTRGDLWISWEEGLQHFLKYGIIFFNLIFFFNGSQNISGNDIVSSFNGLITCFNNDCFSSSVVLQISFRCRLVGLRW